MRVTSIYVERDCIIGGSPIGRRLVCAACILIVCWQISSAYAQNKPAQSAAPLTTEQKIEQLTTAVAQAQTAMANYQKQLIELRQQLAALQQQMAEEKAASATSAESASTNTNKSEHAKGELESLEEIQEKQAIEESQIATHEVTKVETESKYPLSVSGLLLFNGFVNTRQVDIAPSPAYALPGSGSTGFSIRQTVLGLDARGPHVFGATSHGDLRVDFFANGAQSNYAASGILRLRTAHAALDWGHTQSFVEYDRSILEPNAPSSLVAIAQPELAWAGDLWSWNPQIGVSHEFSLFDSVHIQTQAALIDSSDPQIPSSTATPSPVTQTERSRWPGTEARIAFLHGTADDGLKLGVGGYFSPHRNDDGERFNAWAGTVDSQIPLSRFFEITANAYRGQALAGLGGGGYVNYIYQYAGSTEIARALDDVGGWAQLKAKAGQKIEMNAGYGIDNPFVKEIHTALLPLKTPSYGGLTRNRSFFSNIIYSPSAYLLFSLEYRRFWTNYVDAPT